MRLYPDCDFFGDAQDDYSFPIEGAVKVATGMRYVKVQNI